MLGFLSYPSLEQQPQSQPLSEMRIKAGDPFEIEVDVKHPSPQNMNGGATYSTASIGTIPGSGIMCVGSLSAGQTKFKLTCGTGRNTQAGEYRGTGTLTLSSPETSEAKQYPDIRLPIVTIVANPFDAVQFPEIAGATLSPTTKQSLDDGSIRAQTILDSLVAHFPGHIIDSRQTRLYLIDQADTARRIVDTTRQRYVAASNPSEQAPIFFEDFDNRLNEIIRGLGGSPRRSTVAQRSPVAPHFALVQLPRSSDSVTVTPQPDNLDKSLAQLVTVLIDIIKGFPKMGEAGTAFTWSVSTTPPGAEVFISRLGLPEQKWSGRTNMAGQRLENARWTFRIDWNGCWKTETPNPYLQGPIAIQLVKTGCVKR
jgi:hypothetical protein